MELPAAVIIVTVTGLLGAVALAGIGQLVCSDDIPRAASITQTNGNIGIPATHKALQPPSGERGEG